MQAAEINSMPDTADWDSRNGERRDILFRFVADRGRQNQSSVGDEDAATAKDDTCREKEAPGGAVSPDSLKGAPPLHYSAIGIQGYHLIGLIGRDPEAPLFIKQNPVSAVDAFRKGLQGRG